MPIRVPRYFSWLLLPSVLLSACIAALAQPSGDPKAARIAKIAFEGEAQFAAGGTSGNSTVEGLLSGSIRSNIYVRDPLDSKARWIAEGEYPAWSPDGSRLVYCSVQDRNYGQLHVVNANGKGDRVFTRLKYGACYPEWSPDGKQVVLTLIETLSAHLAIVDENGVLVRELGEGRMAHWSPDGKQLVFIRPRAHLKDGDGIWIVNADGSGEREVIEEGTRPIDTSWLPNMTGLIFSSPRDGALSAVYTVGLDGKNLRKLGGDPGMSWFYPTLAPDGSSLIVEVDTPLDVSPRRISVVQIDAKTHQVTMLAYGHRPNVLWRTGTGANPMAAGKDRPANR